MSTSWTAVPVSLSLSPFVPLLVSIYLVLFIRLTFPLSQGYPVNQEDMIGTLNAFSGGVLIGLDKLDVHVSAEEREAWISMWQYIGYLLGLNEAARANLVLCLTFAPPPSLSLLFPFSYLYRLCPLRCLPPPPPLNPLPPVSLIGNYHDARYVGELIGVRQLEPDADSVALTSSSLALFLCLPSISCFSVLFFL